MGQQDLHATIANDARAAREPPQLLTRWVWGTAHPLPLVVPCCHVCAAVSLSNHTSSPCDGV